MKPRYSDRVSVKCPVIFTLGSMVGEGEVQDLTNPGCMIQSPAHVCKGEYLQLKMYLPELKAPLSVEMGVVRWTNGPRFGVEFIKMSGTDRALLAQFISRHQRPAWRRIAGHAETTSVDTCLESTPTGT
ncbi:MAG TPA: PilZ domain-containing protein [Nitrospira sp.]|nr:PilZ domain-containing protein [Nitrospira sp.]